MNKFFKDKAFDFLDCWVPVGLTVDVESLDTTDFAELVKVMNERRELRGIFSIFESNPLSQSFLVKSMFLVYSDKFPMVVRDAESVVMKEKR